MASRILGGILLVLMWASLSPAIAKAPALSVDQVWRVQLHIYSSPSLSSGWTQIDIQRDKAVYRQNAIVNLGAEKRMKTVKKRAVRPSPEQWARFLAALRQAQVLKWAPEYEAPRGAGDGSSWFVNILAGTTTVKSAGAQNYPSARNVARPSNSATPSAPFRMLTHGVNDLFGEALLP